MSGSEIIRAAAPVQCPRCGGVWVDRSFEIHRPARYNYGRRIDRRDPPDRVLLTLRCEKGHGFELALSRIGPHWAIDALGECGE